MKKYTTLSMILIFSLMLLNCATVKQVPPSKDTALNLSKTASIAQETIYIGKGSCEGMLVNVYLKYSKSANQIINFRAAHMCEKGSGMFLFEPTEVIPVDANGNFNITTKFGDTIQGKIDVDGKITGKLSKSIMGLDCLGKGKIFTSCTDWIATPK